MIGRNFYRSINELPFCNYKMLTIDNDLSALCKDDATRETLQSESGIDFSKEGQNTNFLTPILICTAETITQEFKEQLAGEEFGDYIGFAYNIEKLAGKIDRLKKNLILFCNYPSQIFIDQFEAESITYPTDDLNEYKTKVFNEICSMEIRLELSKQRFENRYHKENAIQPTHQYYVAILGQIGDMKGREVPDNITTLTFCVYYNELRRFIEKQQQKLKYGTRSTR